MLPDVEKKNRRIGIGVTIVFHGLILLLFFFIMAWREPDPPVPEYGIELNFGLDEYGSGEVQPEEPPAAPSLIPEQIIEENIPEEIAENQPMAETEVEETQEIAQEEMVEDSKMEDSPDVIEPVTTQTESVVEPEKEEVVQQQNDQPEVEKEIIEEQIISQNEKVTESIDESEGVAGVDAGVTEAESHGNDPEAVGDAGNPQSTLDSRALYGKYGGGGGPTLELAGWTWDEEPNVKDTSKENGKIVFEIKIDDFGEIISVRTLETTVSPVVERIYKTEVERLTFSPISTNTSPAAVSTGKITFIITSK